MKSGLYREFADKVRKGFQKFFGNRPLVIGVLMAVAAVVIFVRLFTLQIVESKDYYENYMNTTMREVSIPAMRGSIYDRNGNLLAGNKVVHNVTVTDGNYYTKSDGRFNEMLLRLIELLEKYDVDVEHTIPVRIGERGLYEYDGSETRVRRFIRDVYSEETIEKQAEEGVDVYAYDAETVMSYLMKNLYNFSSKWVNAPNVSKEHALKICHIRYALSARAFTRYIPTNVATDISEELQAAVLESGTDLLGVRVEENYERVYYDSECFSSILGYVGSITTEEIEELNASGGSYIGGDVIGKEGVESAYESYLQGTKGKRLLYVNSTGMILHEEIISEPLQGADVYLSIDRDLTIAAYNIMEQQLSGIIVNHLYEGTDYDPMVAYENNQYLLPIRDVYFQMINNNIIDVSLFASSDASFTANNMERKRIAKKQSVARDLRKILETRDQTPLESLSKYEQQYIRYFYTYLRSTGYLLPDAIDVADQVYKGWRNGTVSFPEFLLHALREGWIDMQKTEAEGRYNDVDNCYAFLTDHLIGGISADYGDFDKLVYDELIHEDAILGTEIGIAMYDQGILKMDRGSYQKLLEGDNDVAFAFFRDEINAMRITPQQIALDPCSAGVVLTDPNTGELLTVCSYPGYDSNRINDSAYYQSLLVDQSSPLYSRATQSRLAPGSTFKMITAIGALEGGYLGEHETITCEGIFDKLDHPRCWIYRASGKTHGALDVVHALGQSCNCFFYECGYRFATNANGQYSISTGIAAITKYAELFGFGTRTGVESEENVSVITTELPVTSAIGQGTNAFTTISLARYVTAIASDGNIYEFKYLNRVVDRTGKVILSYSPVIERTLSLKQSTWDAIHEGMYTVVHDGGSRNGDFWSLKYNYAAKSGSAQENKLRPEHGLYVTYGPYDDIRYAMAVQVPNGYGAGNAALISAGIYEYLEGDVTLEEILQDSASNREVIDIQD